ncbi:MAG: B12-binding domain-containing radical SAM protein [Candidatus Omnitrophica bacterium]|nr:B12-binding domain-containing radical SAM protein [Candidatus Omnitrophota bacterium]
MSDIVLIFPKTGFDLGASVAPPHSLLTIAAPLKKAGYKIKIIDQRINTLWKDELREELKSGPLCVGISSMTGSQINFALETARLVRQVAKQEKMPIVWGGPHPSILPTETLENEFVDIVVIGEGDITFFELVRAIEDKKSFRDVKGIAYKENGNIIVNPPRELLDVQMLLLTPWDLVDVEKYIHPDFYLKKTNRTLDIGQTSRGCPYQCGFCCSATIRKRLWRPMSLKKSLNFIINDVQRFNLDGIWLRDDNFYVDSERTKAICQGMVDAKLKIDWYSSGTRVDTFLKLTPDTIRAMRDSGAHVLKFGAESGSNRILNLIKKGITVEQTFLSNLKAKEWGIRPAYSFMAGFPGETFEEVNMTIDAMNKLVKDNPDVELESICIYTALPGTPMYELAISCGLNPPKNLEEWSNWTFHEYAEERKNPWFSKQDRLALGNLTYLSTTAFAVANLLRTIRSPLLKILAQIFVLPITKYCEFRFKHKLYRFAPELKIISYLRKKIFDRIHVKI